MNRIVGFAALVLPCLNLPAQTPPSTPAGESAKTFTAAEAYAFACCQQVGAAWRQGALFDLSQWTGLPGYKGMLAAPPRGGSPAEMQFVSNQPVPGWEAQVSSAGTGLGLAGGDVLCYLVPQELGGGAKR